MAGDSIVFVCILVGVALFFAGGLAGERRYARFEIHKMQ